MKRAALARNALTLPPKPSVTLEVVGGRQQVVRHGVFLGVFAGRNRTLYQQFDGELILADECKCRVDYCFRALTVHEECNLTFSVVRAFDCPIDEHRVVARNQLDEGPEL
jgi:hypothetical protein